MLAFHFLHFLPKEDTVLASTLVTILASTLVTILVRKYYQRPSNPEDSDSPNKGGNSYAEVLVRVNPQEKTWQSIGL